MTPFFSIVIATYNCAHVIDRCLKHVYDQTLKAEVFLVDNCSTDGTVDIVKKKYLSTGVNLIVERDHGVFDAWNKAIEKTKGEWLIFLGADDYFPDNHALESLAQEIKKNEHFRIFYGSVTVINEQGEIMRNANAPWEEMKKHLKTTLPFTHVGTAHHRSLFENNQRFDKWFRIAGDYDFLYAELVTRGAKFAPDYKIFMELGGLSTTLKNRQRLIEEVEYAWKKNGIRVSIKSRFWMKTKKLIFSVLVKFRKNARL